MSVQLHLNRDFTKKGLEEFVLAAVEKYSESAILEGIEKCSALAWTVLKPIFEMDPQKFLGKEQAEALELSIIAVASSK